MSFANQLRAQRERLGCSQSAFVLLMPGLPLRTLQAWERDQQTPPPWVQWLVLIAVGGGGGAGGRKRVRAERRKAPNEKLCNSPEAARPPGEEGSESR
jgi:hypothetical protein